MTSEKTMRLTEFQIKARGHSEKQIEDVNKLVQRINLHRFDSDKSFKGLLNNRRVRKQLTPQSGVIIFTNKSKFRTLFKSLSFGDVRIDDAIHTINAIWDDKKSDYVYKSISKFKEDEPLILIASYSDRYAIEDFQNRYKNLDTIIFDEADKNDKKIEDISADIYNKINDPSSKIRDAYFIKSENSIFEYDKLNARFPYSFSWMTTSQDIDEDFIFNIKVIDCQIDNVLQKNVFNIISKLRSLFDFDLVKELLPIYRSFTNIEHRINSFYEINDLRGSIAEFENDLRSFITDNFPGEFQSEFNLETEQYLDVIKDQISEKKVTHFINEISDLSEGANIRVVSLNKNQTDIEFLLDYMDHAHHVEFVDFNCNVNDSNLDSHTFSFGSNIPFANKIWFNNDARKITFLLNRSEINKLKRLSFFTAKIVNRITEKKKRHELLNYNLGSQNLEIFDSGPQLVIPNIFPEDSIEIPVDSMLDVDSEKDNESLLEFVHKEFNDGLANDSSSFKNDAEEIVIGFDDGSVHVVGFSQSFYLSLDLDDDEVSDISKVRITADHLKEDDEILWFTSDNYKELTEIVSEKLLRSPSLRAEFEQSESWRVMLNKIIAKYGQGIDGRRKVSEILKKTYGLPRTQQAIKNWSNGYTRVPNKPNEIISALNEIAQSINEDVVENINDMVYIAKSFKSYYSKVPSRLRTLVTARKYDIPVQIEPEFIEVLDDIADNIEIKKIIFITKKCQ